VIRGLVALDPDCAASSFLVDMNKLFERFVTERLRRALTGRLEVRSEPPVHLGEGKQVLMNPDLEFRRRRVTVYVGDIKYKLTGDAKARNADYYQLLAYTTAMNLDEGVLIYCLADGGRPSRSVSVRHAGKVLHTLALDLSGPPAQVAQEIELLADWIADASWTTVAERTHPRSDQAARKSVMSAGSLRRLAHS